MRSNSFRTHLRLTLNMVILACFFLVGLANATEEQQPVLKSWAPLDAPKAFAPAPTGIQQGDLDQQVLQAVEVVFGESLKEERWSAAHSDALQVISESGDVRLAWLVTDLMRIAGGTSLMQPLAAVASNLMGIKLDFGNSWADATDHLMAWNIPAPPNYVQWKRNVFTLIEPQWENIFVEGDIDWRHVSWGGVKIDNRAFGKTKELCNCIPAIDNPEVTDVAGAGWIDDEAVIFGVAVNNEYRAYPRQIMEVREMVNDSLGGRDLGIPYCTLCGAAQAYYTDELVEGMERPVLRTSGLLIRSNKVMYDVNTYSVFDTFRGNAVTGVLAEKGIVLKQAGVITTTWGEWKAAHPQTTVLAEELALGRDFDFRNNRDANGPIFPVGDVDGRLGVHDDIVGIITESGTPIAFHRIAALEALGKGETVSFENVRLMLDAGGIRVVDADDKDLGGHQAFWFAWSQFYPETRLWPMES